MRREIGNTPRCNHVIKTRGRDSKYSSRVFISHVDHLNDNNNPNDLDKFFGQVDAVQRILDYKKEN